MTATPSLACCQSLQKMLGQFELWMFGRESSYCIAPAKAAYGHDLRQVTGKVAFSCLRAHRLDGRVVYECRDA